jgi:hypothetical protein
LGIVYSIAAALVCKVLLFIRDTYVHVVRLRLVIDVSNAERAGIWWFQPCCDHLPLCLVTRAALS